MCPYVYNIYNHYINNLRMQSNWRKGVHSSPVRYYEESEAESDDGSEIGSEDRSEDEYALGNNNV